MNMNIHVTGCHKDSDKYLVALQRMAEVYRVALTSLPRNGNYTVHSVACFIWINAEFLATYGSI